MSALAGRWNLDGRPGAGAACDRMLAAQKLYGPHDSARWERDGGAIALGRCLFRTLPEDRFDRQPLAGAGGRWRLVADVRLDNRAELTAALGLAEAAALPDSAILLAAWERWEEAVFDRLLGDYAFAAWDAHDRRLILARDALGSRPLHYHRGRDFLAFASMPKGLHALADVPYAADEERAAELLVLMPETGPRSYFRDIHRVEGGHYAVLTPQRTIVHRHWQPRRPSAPFRGDAVEAVRAALDSAVAARLRGADGRIATHLSGGLDSAGVTATAARLMAADGGRVIAFTAVPREGYDLPVPEGRIGDEGPLAAATAALYPNIEHVRIRPDGRGITDGFDRDFHLFDRPILNPCNQGWAAGISAAARERHLRVLLTGQMGNMSLSYAGLEYLPELAARGRWLRLAREGRGLVKTQGFRWRGVLAAGLGPWMPERLWTGLHRLGGRTPQQLALHSAIRAEHHAALDLAARAREAALDTSYRPRRDGFEARLWILRRTDPGNYLKGFLGGWGVDMRDPTADRRLIELCLSLPMEAFLAAGEPRALARRVLADRLPAAVLSARGSGLQAADWHESLAASRGALREEIARLAQVPAAAEALDLERMRRMIEDWPADGWHRPEVSTPYRFALLRGAVTGHFLRKVSRSNA